MGTDKENLDFDKVEAFIMSPAGFWVVLVVVAGIAIAAFGNTVLSWFGIVL